jgi:hypothetical protein
MQKVEMVVGGKRALVDADMAKKMAKKEALVAEALAFKKFYNADPVNHAYVGPMIEKVMGKIIRLNRTIRPNVQFL